MSVRYIGSKERFAHDILRIIEDSTNANGSRFVDAFCGAGSVAREAFKRNYRVHVNDVLLSSVHLSLAGLIAVSSAKFLEGYKGLTGTIDYLNAIPAEHGFIFQNYSVGGSERAYFTPSNAARVDAIRSEIENLFQKGLISDLEKIYLIASLIHAMSQVANTAGTYGAFLKKITNQAQKRLALSPLDIIEGNEAPTWNQGNAADLDFLPSDIVYVDPPYTKRQYSNYYHLQETVASNRKPALKGVTGLPYEGVYSSEFCYKRKAVSAFSNLFSNCQAENIFISYSDQSHITIEQLVELAECFGAATIHKLGSIPRYKSRRGLTGNPVNEYLIHLRRTNGN